MGACTVKYVFSYIIPIAGIALALLFAPDKYVSEYYKYMVFIGLGGVGWLWAIGFAIFHQRTIKTLEDNHKEKLDGSEKKIRKLQKTKTRLEEEHKKLQLTIDELERSAETDQQTISQLAGAYDILREIVINTTASAPIRPTPVEHSENRNDD